MANQPNAPQQPAPPGFRFAVWEVDSSVFPNVIHGIGIITTVQIPAGAVILTEAPLFRLRSNEFIVPPSAIVHTRWPTLPASSPSAHGPHYDKFKANALRCGTHRDLDLVIEEGVSGFFPLASKINSSCAPNVHAHWNISTQHMEFRALRTIHQMEELCICYDVNTPLYSKEHRQQRLSERYGFICRCPVCFLPTYNSDLRRSSHREIIEKGGGSIRNPSDAIRRIGNAIVGLQNEGIYHFNDTLYYDLYCARERAGDTNAMLSLRSARDWARVMVGVDDPRVKQMTEELGQ